MISTLNKLNLLDVVVLTQLDQDYDRTTPTGQAMIRAIDHPAVKPVEALLKGFMDAK